MSDLGYTVSLEEAGWRPTKEAEEAQGELRFPKYKLWTKWAMVESLSRSGPLLSAHADAKSSSITSQLTDEFKATEISLNLLILINIRARRMSVFSNPSFKRLNSPNLPKELKGHLPPLSPAISRSR